MDAAADAASQEADGVAADAQAGVPNLVSRRGDCAYQSHPARLGAVLCGRSLESLLLVHPRLGRAADSGPLGACAPASRLRMEEVEQSVVVWRPRSVQ